MLILSFLFIGFFLILVYMYYETTCLNETLLNFSCAGNNLKIVHLSDIHIDMLNVPASKILNSLKKHDPDYIFITGDLLSNKKNIPKLLNFISEINYKNNIVLTLGNHDYETFGDDINSFNNYKEQLRNCGVLILENDYFSVKRNSIEYFFSGINDIRYKKHDLQKALPKNKNKNQIFLGFSHNPDIVFEIPKNTLDYLFCGHFHGGQIWAPFNLEFSIMRSEKLCKMNIIKGLHYINGIRLFISRGLGNVLLPFRLFSKPEITIIYL